jgi:hypothetical protein
MVTRFAPVFLLVACTSDSSTEEPIDLDWDTACNPFSMGDDCFLPFPSLHFTEVDESSPTGRRLAYQSEYYYSPDGALDFDFSIVNFADGSSPIGPAFVNFGVDIDPSYLSGWNAQAETVEDGASIALIHAETGESVPILTEMDQAQRIWETYDERHPLIIRPLGPMEFGARYFVVLTQELRDVDGQTLPESEVFAALRDGVLTTDETIEEMRPRYDAFFDLIEPRCWERDELLLAWDFQVASEESVLGPVRTIRDAITQEMDPTSFEYTFDTVQEDPNDSTAWLIEGTFYPPNYLLEDSTLDIDSDGVLHEQEDRYGYDFAMVVPAVARERGALSLVLIGHGIFGTGADMLASSWSGDIFHPMANDLGAVFIATDWIGLSGGDRDLILEEVLPDVERVRVVTDRLVQSHGNNLALVEMALSSIISDPVIQVDHAQPLIDGDEVYYYGISLGGVQGAGQTALSPRISRSVLAVPGAGWAHLIQRSTQFEPLETLFDALYPDPLTQSLLLGMSQTFFDWSDPGNLARLIADPDPGYEQTRTVVLQEAIGDCQVANITTDLLARTMGASHLEEATDPVFGLETVASPYTGVALTQIRVQDSLDAYFPPDENTTPVMDNGVHNSGVLRDTIFNQIFTLIETGELIHPCDGPCDPD